MRCQITRLCRFSLTLLRWRRGFGVAPRKESGEGQAYYSSWREKNGGPAGCMRDVIASTVHHGSHRVCPSLLTLLLPVPSLLSLLLIEKKPGTIRRPAVKRKLYSYTLAAFAQTSEKRKSNKPVDCIVAPPREHHIITSTRTTFNDDRYEGEAVPPR